METDLIKARNELAALRMLQNKKDLIIKAQLDKGLKASGKSALGLTVKQEDDKMQLVDKEGYFQQQEFGRGPGLPPAFEDIYEWVGLKKYGIEFENEFERRLISWKIVKSIQQGGTYTFKKKQPTGVLGDVINNELYNELLSEMVNVTAAAIKTDIVGIYLRK